MRVVKFNDYWLVVRGKNRVQWFSFFVDHDSSSWTNRRDGAQLYRSEEAAKGTIAELKRRAAASRKWRWSRHSRKGDNRG